MSDSKDIVERLYELYWCRDPYRCAMLADAIAPAAAEEIKRLRREVVNKTPAATASENATSMPYSGRCIGGPAHGKIMSGSVPKMDVPFRCLDGIGRTRYEWRGMATIMRTGAWEWMEQMG